MAANQTRAMRHIFFYLGECNAATNMRIFGYIIIETLKSHTHTHKVKLIKKECLDQRCGTRNYADNILEMCINVINIVIIILTL